MGFIPRWIPLSSASPPKVGSILGFAVWLEFNESRPTETMRQGNEMSWSERLKDKFPKEEQKKEREHDVRVLSKEKSWEFEKALKERLKNLRMDCLTAIGKD